MSDELRRMVIWSVIGIVGVGVLAAVYVVVAGTN